MFAVDSKVHRIWEEILGMLHLIRNVRNNSPVYTIYMTFTLVETPVSELVTTTAYSPAGLAGAMQVMEVELTMVTLVHMVPPTVTVAPVANKVPIMVRVSPPRMCLGWMTGLTDVTVGGIPANGHCSD